MACRANALSEYTRSIVNQTELECGPMPNVMATLPNIGGAVYESCIMHSLYHAAKFG